MDIGTITGICALVVQILGSLFMAIIFCVIKFNDMVHLEKKVDKLIDCMETLPCKNKGCKHE